MKRIYQILIGVFVVAGAVQWLAITNAPILDQGTWVTAVEYFFHHDPRIIQEPSYAYPGTPLLMIPYALQGLFHASALQAFILGLALLNGAAIAGLSAVCFALWPRTVWWLIVAGMLMCERLILTATPPSALVSLLVPLIFLLALLAARQGKNSRPITIITGIVVGASLATRLDISGLALLAIIIWFYFNALLRTQLPRLLTTTVMSFIILDPYLWFMPLEHIQGIAEKFIFHYAHLTTRNQTFLDALLRSPLAVAGFVITTILVWKNMYFDRLERRFFALLIIFSAVTVALIMNARYKTAWYFYPLFFFWEIITPRFVLALLPHIEFSFVQAGNKQQASIALHAFFVVLFIGSYLAALLHFISIPG